MIALSAIETTRFLDLVSTPAIDSGSADGAPDHDHSGAPRPAGGDGDGAGVIDLGAVELPN